MGLIGMSQWGCFTTLNRIITYPLFRLRGTEQKAFLAKSVAVLRAEEVSKAFRFLGIYKNDFFTGFTLYTRQILWWCSQKFVSGNASEAGYVWRILKNVNNLTKKKEFFNIPITFPCQQISYLWKRNFDLFWKIMIIYFKKMNFIFSIFA